MKLTELLYPFAFLPVCLLLYYVLPKRCRNAALLAASLLFFAWGTPEYLVLLVLAILLNYFAGLELESLLEDGKTGHARLVLVLTILADLLPLLFFKYYGEAAAALNRVFVLSLPVHALPAPVGVSFYTFTLLSALSDVYHGRAPMEKNLIRFALFVSFFPKLTSGPIVPNAWGVLSEKLPAGAPVEDQKALIDAIDQAMPDVRTANLTEALRSRRSEPLYYRTDHHWTSLAARYAFETLSAQLDLQPVRSYTVYPVSDSFEGTLAAKTGSHAALDTIEIYVPDTDVQYAVTYADTQTTICSLYDRAKLAEKNQYEVFFGGNHARVDIQTTADTGRTLLLLKDSYANCFVQFLTPYYDRILMIDPRYFYDDLGALLRRERVTDALILYNYNTFVQDHALSVVLQSALFDEGE